MKINLAKSAGFCFGVKRALNIALKTASASKQVSMLGDIVHNEEVVKQVHAAGIKKIKKLTAQKQKNTLLIRAHGASLKTIASAQKCGYQIVDATCPMVKEIHKIAKEMERKGFRLIVIGDKKHDEVLGILGQLQQKALVIDQKEHIPFGKIRRLKKTCVIVQSTQNTDKVLEIVDILKQHIAHLRFFNTICMPTRIKQKEIKELPLQNDLMLIIGSKTSANTKRLYEISRSLNPRTHWIFQASDIEKDWLKGIQSIGITAGASTPEQTTQEVIAYLKKIG